MRRREKIYYYSAWTESDCLLGCSHEHESVTEAVDCDASVRHAGSYVVAVENGIERALNNVEEAEFQRATRKRSVPAVLEYEASEHALMIRGKFPDGLGWYTWRRFETYEQALEHATTGDRIVPFGSPEWNALRESREPALPAPPIPPLKMQPPRRAGETLFEYVTRLIPSPIDQREVTEMRTTLPVASGSWRPTFVEFVLHWISNWEVKALEKIHSLLISAAALILTLRRCVRKARSPERGAAPS